MANCVHVFYSDQITSPKTSSAQWVWEVLPCTIAVMAGPLVATLYSLLRSEDAKDGSFSIGQALNGVLCLMMFLSLFLLRRLRLLELPIIRPIIFLSVYAIITCFLGPYPYENIAFAVKLAFVAFIFASAFHLAQSNLCGEGWLVGNAWVVLIFMAVSQVIGFVTGHTIALYSKYATAGITDRVSVTASFVVATLPIFLRFFPSRRWSVAGITIVLTSLFFTMRRTELISAICATFIVMIRNLNQLRRNMPSRVVVSAVLALGGLAAIGLQSPAGSDLLARMSNLDPSKGTGSGRYIFWRVSLNHIFDRSISAQIIGEGMGSIRDVMYEDFGHSIGSHTAWLDMTHAFGVFGLLAILWWYFELFLLAKYMSATKNAAFQGVFSAIVIFFLVSIGQGGFSDPAYALIYAALGFWAGQTGNYRRQVFYA